MPVRIIQKIILGLILVVNLFLWYLTSDVATKIANDQTLVFGRYSLGRFNSLLICLFISCILSYLLWGNLASIKKRAFKVICVVLAMAISLVVVDSLARLIVNPRYFSNQQSGLQVADNTYTVTISDVPGAVRKFPAPKPGFPALNCTVTMDGRGFRNRTTLDRYDVVTLGDSFTEGFYVSDDQPWPMVLSEYSGLSVYNLGMSGTGPLMYLLALQKFGRKLAPKIAICMLTEISDFKAAPDKTGMERFQAVLADDRTVSHRDEFKTHKTSFAKSLEAYLLRSPLKISFNNLCRRDLARIHLRGKTEGLDILSWMPVKMPLDARAKYYSFSPNRLLDFYKSKEEFQSSPGWKTAAYALIEMQRICREAGVRFLVAYAPNKIHVVLPLIEKRLPPDKLLAFATLKSDRGLPSPSRFYETLFRRLYQQEAVVSEFCKENAIEFVSTTKRLREMVAQGEQLYFTYDSHWTPPGHRVVAEVIYRHVFAEGNNK